MQSIWAVQTSAVDRTVDLPPGWTIEPVAGAMGVYVRGAELHQLDDVGLAAVRSLIHEYKAVMFLGQDPGFDKKSYVTFGRRLGELALDPYVAPVFPEHPEIMGLIREADDASYNFGGDWHSDGTYLERPGGLTVLRSVEVPLVGGDTLFADMELAWSMLSPAYQEMLDGRRCLHAATGLGTKLPIARKGDYATVTFGTEREVIEHYHPIRRTHPETGGSSLFVNQAYSVQIEGCTEDESASILSFLFQWSTSPAMTARFRWEPDAVLIWDNRNTLHYAIGDYGGHRREMYRLAIVGERPE